MFEVIVVDAVDNLSSFCAASQSAVGFSCQFLDST